MASEMWFSGFDPDGGNNWASGDDETGGDAALTLRASPSQIETGGQTRLIAESDDLGLLGKLVTLTIGSPSVATTTTLTAIMEPDAYGKAAATFLVEGLTVGSSVISAVVSG